MHFCICSLVLMASAYRTQCSDRWIISIILVILVPPCGCVSVLCLALAQRSRQAAGDDAATAAHLERISDIAIAVALCCLLTVKFYAEQLHRPYFLHHLANCSEVSVNDTSLSPTVESFSSESLPVPLDDSAVKQRFALNKSLLQPPVDVELSVVGLHPNLNMLPMRHRKQKPLTTERFPWNLLSQLYLYYDHHFIPWHKSLRLVLGHLCARFNSRGMQLDCVKFYRYAVTHRTILFLVQKSQCFICCF